ncbi:elongation factor 1-alpha, partial [Trifolium medium]|nr:elongation factor 1-alpha [Trifolium medium]
SDSTPQPPVSVMGPPKRKNRSEAWKHFTPVSDNSKSAKCSYCGKLIKYSGGTSAMRAHLLRCKKNPNNVVNTPPHGSGTSSMETTVNSSPPVP